MTTLESLIAIVGNVSRQEHKLVRRYLTVRNQEPNQMLRLFDLLFDDPQRNWTTADLEKLLKLQRHHAAFARLVSQLRKRLIEALSLPIVTTNDRHSGRMQALIGFHRKYLEALILFAAGDYRAVDETLLSMLPALNKHELHAESIAVLDFLMHVIRVNGNLDALDKLRHLPAKFHQAQLLISSAEEVRDQIDAGKITQLHPLYLDLKDVARKTGSARALYMFNGIEGRLAEQRKEYGLANEYFLEQLKYCNDPAVNSDELRGQVYVDLARNELNLKRKGSARKFLKEAMRSRVQFKATAIEIERLRDLLKP